jgi:hypothetical protein
MGESSFRGDLFPPMRETSMFGGARGGRQGMGGSGHGRDGGKNSHSSHAQARPGSLVPKGGLGGTRKRI